MADKNKVHLIGNAHLDPIFLWTLPDGLSEIKATFRSALDRIKEFDDFVFTSAAISYYAWVKDNCPDMFEEIKDAVRSGHWSIAGGMWVQPDCNIPSAESFARQMLYSQKFVRENFGITVKTGYNVDSFGHTASLPRLLNEGGIENYVYMRPAAGEEKTYPFDDNLFFWRYDGGETLTFRIIDGYGTNLTDDKPLRAMDERANDFSHDIMMFYGVGNHGGGPTIRNIRQIHKYREQSAHEFVFSCPDRFFDEIRAADTADIPAYSGDLQNHASGCYSANSYVKAANCFAEDRLCEAEKWLFMSEHLTGMYKNEPRLTEEAWKGVLFNQFHDLLCGCSVKASFDDAKGDFEYARSVGFKLKSRALQSVSWAIDTEKGVKKLSKDSDWLWETDDFGTPVVVFNPLSYDVKVPVSIRKPRYCGGITYIDNTGAEIPLPVQMIRGDMTEHDYKHTFMINAPVPAFGYRTFWVYAQKKFEAAGGGRLKADDYTLENSEIRVKFDKETGNVCSLIDKRSGMECVGEYACRPVLIDDSPNDTWAHGNFVFDKIEGEFTSPEFRILEQGDCVVSLSVKQFCGNNYIEQIYSLYPDESVVRISARLFMYDELKMVKLTFNPSFGIDTAIYGCAGSVIEKPADGREQPMQRFVAVTDSAKGLCVCARGKYSASASNDYFAFAAVRTCYYADHVGERDGRLIAQDIGLNEFEYTLSPFCGDICRAERTSEILHSEFPLINETYHKGSLKQSCSLISVEANNVSVAAVKKAEDNTGVIIRIRETAGYKTDTVLKYLGREYNITLAAHDYATFKVENGEITKTNFIEY